MEHTSFAHVCLFVMLQKYIVHHIATRARHSHAHIFIYISEKLTIF